MTTIKINDVSYPIKYGWAALRTWSELTGKNLSDLEKADGNTMDIKDLLSLIFSGLKHGARVDKTESFDLDLDGVGDLMDDSPELMNVCMEEFAKSMAPNKQAVKGPRKKQAR